LFSFKSGDITLGSPVGLRIGLSGSAAEVIEEKDPEAVINIAREARWVTPVSKVI
jgi:hypothetical protein